MSGLVLSFINAKCFLKYVVLLEMMPECPASEESIMLDFDPPVIVRIELFADD